MKLYTLILSALLLSPFFIQAQKLCEYVNIGCDEENSLAIFDLTGTPEDPIIVNVIPSSTFQTTEIAYDGNCLWVGSGTDSMLYGISKIDGSVMHTIQTNIAIVGGLTFDGQFLWVSENYNSGGQDSIFQINIGLPPVSTKMVADESNIELFPNPTSDVFHIKVKAESNHLISKITVTTLDGKILFQSKLEDQYLDNYEISLADQSPGIYFCQIIIDGQVVVKKIVKQ